LTTRPVKQIAEYPHLISNTNQSIKQIAEYPHLISINQSINQIAEYPHLISNNNQSIKQIAEYPHLISNTNQSINQIVEYPYLISNTNQSINHCTDAFEKNVILCILKIVLLQRDLKQFQKIWLSRQSVNKTNFDISLTILSLIHSTSYQTSCDL
jgi:hypothetical protein